jgi:small-conductance mechanosensitive channel
VWAAAAVLLVMGIIAIRRTATALGHLITTRELPAAGAAVRLITSGVGYIFIIFAELGLLDVSIEHLLVGAGLAGVVLGIAAQQSLSNVFAALVLLLARPFAVGDHVRIRSGAMGGIFDAVVVSLSLTYVTMRTDDGILQIPNSVMLATAVGPIAAKDEIVAG